MNKKGQALGLILGVIIFAIVCILSLTTFGMINVKPAQVAVEINKVAGKVSEKSLLVGYHFYNRWVTDMVIYNVAARSYPSDTRGSENEKDYTMELKTNDGQNVLLDLTVIYALKANDVPALHQTIGTNYEDQVLLPQIRSEARIAIGNYSAEEIYQGKVRDQIQQTIKSKLITAVANFPAIQIQDALIRHFQFSPAFEQAIEQKKLAAQKVEINKNMAAAQEQESLRQEAEARGKKLQAVQAAEGEAQAVKINADAKRYQLEQEAAGNLARYKADAEGKRLQAEALGGGQNVVALEFAQRIPDKLQIWGIPVGANNTSLMDISGIFKGMLNQKE